MNNQPKINLAKDEREVRQCWPVFRELRPHIESEDEFVQRWQRQSGEGYQIAYVRGEDRVVAAAGYRFLTTMAWGHILYIDDLVATELSQGKGLGTLLLRFLQKAPGIAAALPSTWIQVISGTVRIAPICATAFSYIVTICLGELCVTDSCRVRRY